MGLSVGGWVFGPMGCLVDCTLEEDLPSSDVVILDDDQRCALALFWLTLNDRVRECLPAACTPLAIRLEAHRPGWRLLFSPQFFVLHGLCSSVSFV